MHSPFAAQNIMCPSAGFDLITMPVQSSLHKPCTSRAGSPGFSYIAVHGKVRSAALSVDTHLQSEKGMQ